MRSGGRNDRSPESHPRWLEAAPAAEVVAWALERWGRRVALGTSFQRAGMVVLDLAWRIDPSIRVFTLDTGRLPGETHEFIDRVRDHYGIDVEVVFPAAADVEALGRRGGANPFYRSLDGRLDCCRARKVEPLRRALAGLDAWMTGLRREQTATRAALPVVAPDVHLPRVLKVSPLAGWSAEQVEEYTRAQGVPRHPLYARGYASIGCAPCTRPAPDDDPRSGRWWWESDREKECGLHWPGGGATRRPPSAEEPAGAIVATAGNDRTLSTRGDAR